MSNSTGNFLASFLDFILSLFKTKEPAPAPIQPTTIPDSPDEPATITTSKVLVIIYDPPWTAARNFPRP